MSYRTVTIVKGVKRVVETYDNDGLVHKIIVCEPPLEEDCIISDSKGTNLDAAGQYLPGIYTNVNAFVVDTPTTVFGGINIELEVTQDPTSGEKQYTLKVPITSIYTDYNTWDAAR